MVHAHREAEHPPTSHSHLCSCLFGERLAQKASEHLSNCLLLDCLGGEETLMAMAPEDFSLGTEPPGTLF